MGSGLPVKCHNHGEQASRPLLGGSSLGEGMDMQKRTKCVASGDGVEMKLD